jgi:hypothetical protein
MGAPDLTPSARWKIALPLVAVWLLLCLGLFSRHLPSPDDAVYDYIGWIEADGGTPYVDASDQNFPGMMLIHRVSATLFGHGLYSYRLLDAILLAVTALGIGRLFRKQIGNAAAVWFACVYVVVYTTQDSWTVGQRDIICAPLLLVASWLQLKYLARQADRSGSGSDVVPGGRAASWLPSSVGVGLLIGAAVLIRPTMLAHWGVLVLVDLAITRRLSRLFLARHAVELLTAALVLGLIALLGTHSGATRRWYEDAVRYNVEVYAVHGVGGRRNILGLWPALFEALKYWVWLWLFAALGFFWLRRRDRSVALHVLAVAVTALISYVAQGKGFGYHLGPLWIVGALFFAYAMAQIAANAAPFARSAPRWKWARLGILLATGLFFGRKVTHFSAGLLRPRFGLPAQSPLDTEEAGEKAFSFANASAVARRVQSVVPEGETVLVWGRPDFINLLSNRKSPSRLASFAMLDEPRAQFSLYGKWEAEFRRSLTQPGPRLICLFTNQKGPGYRYMPSPDDPGGLSRVLEEVLRERYRPSFQIGVVACFERT